MLAYALPYMYSMFALHLGHGVAVDGFSSLWPNPCYHLQRSSLAYHLSQLQQWFRWRALVRPSLCYKGNWKLKVCVASEQRGSRAEQQRNDHALHELLMSSIPRHGLKGGVPVHLAPKKETQDPWKPTCDWAVSRHTQGERRLWKENMSLWLFQGSRFIKESEKTEYAVHKKRQWCFPSVLATSGDYTSKWGLSLHSTMIWCVGWHSSNMHHLCESSINPWEKPCFVKDPSCFGNGRRRFRVDTASFLVMEKEWTRNISDSVRVKFVFSINLFSSSCQNLAQVSVGNNCGTLLS